MQLGKYHEVIGILSGVKYENSQIKLIFSLQKEIDLPLTAIPIKRLYSLRGKMIGILNVNEEFYVREIIRAGV